MTRSFKDIKSAAIAAKDVVELYKVATESNQKYRKNVIAAQLMSYTAGRAAEADHYFQNVLPAWEAINEEILGMLRVAMEGKSVDEVLEIIEQAEAK